LSYQVIARKWRPQTFESLVGQPHVSQALHNALQSERMPHALLFTGARGVGKTSAARILAKSLRCPNVKAFVPCNVCKECEDIAHGSSLNVMEIDGASNNGVDAIRELRETVGFMPSSGKYKIYIIDEVHMLSTSAFNALLKTLEEPPPHVVFIFATTEAQKIPITILSRCQRFDFRKIPTRQIADRLIAICTAEKVKYTDEAIWLIARQAEGSMRDSQSLLDQAITFTNANLDSKTVIDILGLTDRGLIRTSMEGLITRDPLRVMTVVEKLFVTGFDSRVFMNELLEELRHLLLIKLNPEQIARLVDLPDSEIHWLKELATHLSSEDIHLLFDMALKGAGDLVRAQTPRVVLEMVLLRMVEAPRVVEIEQLLRGKVTAQKTPSATGTATTLSQPVTSPLPASTSLPVSSPPSSSAPTTGPISKISTTLEPADAGLKIPNFALNVKPKMAAEASNGLAEQERSDEKQPTEPRWNPKISPQDNWGVLVEFTRANHALLGAKLEHVAVLSVDNVVLRLGVKPAQEFLVNQLKESRTLHPLQELATRFYGRPMEIQFEVLRKATPDSLSPKAVEEKKVADRTLEIKTEVENHPLVKKAKELFESSIIDIKENRS
jgi:DNA polymerase-3 subunit gamma/tau